MKKILFIASAESDYLQDLSYRGLVELFGVDQVIDLPWNINFHWPKKEYPRNLGYKGINFKHFVSHFRDISWQDISLVIVAAAKPDCLQKYLSLQKKIPSSVPVVFLDGGDFAEIGGDLYRLKQPQLFQEAQEQRPFDFIFKREMLTDRDYPSHVAPLVFAVPSLKISPPNYLDKDMKYQVSFWAVESDPVRSLALGLIENKFDCRENGTTKNQVFKKYKRKGLFYLQELARCKIILNFRGVGWDTLRYWEVFALSRFMISQKPKIQIPHNFENQKEIIFCKDDCSDLVELCDFYLQNEAAREQIARAGYEKARRFHTELARARYIQDTLKAHSIIY